MNRVVPSLAEISVLPMMLIRKQCESKSKIKYVHVYTNVISIFFRGRAERESSALWPIQFLTIKYDLLEIFCAV